MEDDVWLLMRISTMRNFNPRPPHGGRQVVDNFRAYGKYISIHVLRMEDDKTLHPAALAWLHFNPRPPHGGRLSKSTMLLSKLTISIHVLRMEDDALLLTLRQQEHYFNPRPPHGGRPAAHAIYSVSATFQSTSSAWRTTSNKLRRPNVNVISIHVLRMEDDRPHRPRAWFL